MITEALTLEATTSGGGNEYSRRLSVEITPQMEAAGVWVLKSSGIGLLNAEDWEVLPVAREVYLAMRLAVETKSSEQSSQDPESTPQHRRSL
jgi:hypothetical protein